MGKNREEELGHGDDSFLDIVANLVGVMIILIVVMGVRSQVTAKATVEAGIAEKIESELEKPLAKVRMLEEDLIAQSAQLQKHALEVALRKSERDELLHQVNALKQAIEQEIAKLSEKERNTALETKELTELERKLSDLIRQQGDAENTTPSTVVLQHLPTPMAKTVFNKEVHLLLRQGKVSVVPWDRLIESLKQEVQYVVSRNTRKEVIDDQLGPIQGYRMDFRLVAKRGVVTNGTQAGMAKWLPSIDSNWSQLRTLSTNPLRPPSPTEAVCDWN